LDLRGEIELAPVTLNTQITGIGEATKPPTQPSGSGTGSFDECLQTEILNQVGIKLSAHAQKRLAERNVMLDAGEGAKLRSAVDRMAEKGADKSLVLMDDLALVVSARNRVVITAMDAASAREGVFTNIDGAVIV
jgi:flagellar operon protein